MQVFSTTHGPKVLAKSAQEEETSIHDDPFRSDDDSRFIPLYWVLHFPKVLQEHHEWPGLKTVVEVQSTREIKGTETHENHYYITSLAPNPQKIGHIVRSHWAIENSLHWILDISFGDDDSRIRKGNAPQIWASSNIWP